MPAVSIIGPARRSPLERATRSHPKAYLATVTGLKCVLPIAPAEVDLDGYASTFETLERTGRKPLVTRTGAGLRAMSFELFVASEELGASVQSTLTQLAAIAAANSRVTFSYGATERGTWRLTRCSISVTERAPYTNDPTKATVSLAFLEAVDVELKVGPLSGGKAPTKGAAPKAGARPAARPTRTHTVKRGETLAAISSRVYGSPNLWPAIAKANKIGDPRALRVGAVLKLPDRAGRLPGDPAYGNDVATARR